MEKKTYSAIQKQLNFSPRATAIFIHLFLDCVVVLAATQALSLDSRLGYVAAQFLLAALYFRGFSMMHDAVHRAVSKRPWVNDGLGILYGGVCFLPFITWRTMHLEHHFWAGNFDKDPVMKMVRGFAQKSKRQRETDTMLWRSWIPYIAFLQEAVFWTISARFIGDRGRYQGQRMELLASVLTPILMASALLAVGQRLGHWALLLPSVVIYLGMVEIVNLPHHLRLPRLLGEGKLPIWKQYRVSRTCIYGDWFSKLVLLNFNYHAEHHMFPNLPWYELPKAYALVKDQALEGYHRGEGHEWIRENRQRNLVDVFAPTEIIVHQSSEHKAA